MRRSSMHRSKNSITGLVVLFVLAIVVFFGFNGCATSVAQMNTHEEVSTVCSKESVQTGSGDSRSHEYRIYTSSQTYVVKDYYGSNGTRFNSADLYGRIEVGRVYRIKSFGYRVPALSRFWNIETIELTKQEPTGTCGLTPSNN